MSGQMPTYTIYLLTVWFDRAENAGTPQNWRFRLENPKTRDRQGYIGIEALKAGLVEMVNEGRDLKDAEDE